MKKLCTILLSLCLLCLTSQGIAQNFYKDIIVTSPDGIWTDSRAYSTLNDAVTAVGANERTVTIVSPQVVTALTVPANVTLKFERNGSITNSGQLTINSKRIQAGDRQIFTGAGDIDFADGSLVRSAWFANISTAINMTADDKLTLLISKADTVTVNAAVGNNVVLKWDSPENVLSVSGGVVLSNVREIVAGRYKLFEGAGDIDFLDGTRLNLAWFARLRSVITWVESERVTVVVPGTNTVDYSDASPANIDYDFISEQGRFSFSPGVTLSVASPFNIVAKDNQYIFHGTGAIAFIAGGTVSLDWWEIEGVNDGLMLDIADASIPAGTVLISSNKSYVIASNITLTRAIEVKRGATLAIANGITLTSSGPFNAGTYQVFNCTGTGNVSFGASSSAVAYPEWWGANANGVLNCATAIQKAVDATPYGTVVFPAHGSYSIASGITVPYATKIMGKGGRATNVTSSVANISTFTFTGYGAKLENITCVNLNVSTTGALVYIDGAVEFKMHNVIGIGGAYGVYMTGNGADNVLDSSKFYYPYSNAIVYIQNCSGNYFRRMKLDQPWPAGTPAHANFLGAWGPGTAYVAKDVVTSGGYMYQCYIGGTSGLAFPGVAAYETNIVDNTATWRLTGRANLSSIVIDSDSFYTSIHQSDHTGAFEQAFYFKDTLVTNGPQKIILMSCEIGATLLYGIRAEDGAALFISDTTFSTPVLDTGVGLYLNGFAGDVSVVNSQFYGWHHGVNISAGTGTLISNNQFAVNDVGVQVAKDITHFTISNNNLGSSATWGANTAAVTVAAGASDYYNIVNNIVNGAGTGVTDGGTGIHKTLTGNI